MSATPLQTITRQEKHPQQEFREYLRLSKFLDSQHLRFFTIYVCPNDKKIQTDLTKIPPVPQQCSDNPDIGFTSPSPTFRSKHSEFRSTRVHSEMNDGRLLSPKGWICCILWNA